jgi:hypothetical protein
LNEAINVMAYLCYKYQGTKNLKGRMCSRYVLSWSGVPAIRWLAHRLFQFVPQICTVTVSHSPNCNFEDQSLCHILRIANLRTSHDVTFSKLQFGGLVFFFDANSLLDSFGDGHGRRCSSRTEKWWVALSSIFSLNCRHILFTAQCAPSTLLSCTEKIQTTRLYQLLHPLRT